MAGINGYGTLLKRGDGATPTELFVTIANITTINNPELERETYDATAHDSPNNRREHVGGLVDGGECTFTVNYDPAAHATLRADLNDTAARNWRIYWPAAAGGGYDTFKAWLTGISGESPHDGLLTAEFKLKVTGDVTATAGP